MRIGLYMIIVIQFFTPPYQRTASYSSKVNYTYRSYRATLLTHILALSSGAWTRAFGFTIQKLHLSLTPFSKIDVP